MNYVIVPFIRSSAESLGIKRPLKYLYRSMLGDPLKRQDVVD